MGPEEGGAGTALPVYTLYTVILIYTEYTLQYKNTNINIKRIKTLISESLKSLLFLTVN